ncbi:hypothetical protein [Faecalispora jeddahensis]|uniref:hypothetical protein n=1 Tax=Faecalispora jeddahensis TaxID=1414721 RepID=UPI00145BE709|nr:hypothetical protein [Faecalispora jeddahensis]
MPSENKTPHYGLNQWQGNEYPKREDFNQDNALMDAVLAAHETDTTAHMTQAQKDQLAAAVQSATIGGAAVTKSGTALQLPAYPTTLPANGGTAGNTTSVAGAMTVSTAAPTSTLAAGKLWGVYG